VIILRTKLILRLSRNNMKWDLHNQIWAIKGEDKKRYQVNTTSKSGGKNL
jgi:hypothetical protein